MQREKRTGRCGGATVIVDCGMAYEENFAQIKARGHHYLVASRQSERQAWFDEFEEEAGWQELLRQPSPRNPNPRFSWKASGKPPKLG